jgi:tetratricopeptide (TPR) repeat protein
MRRETAAVPAGLCLLVAVGFSGVVHGEFLAFDDDFYVTRNPQGVQYLERALALDPTLAGAQLARGIALERAGRAADAEAAYRAALADPRDTREARLRLARLLAAAPDAPLRAGAEALVPVRAGLRRSAV